MWLSILLFGVVMTAAPWPSVREVAAAGGAMLSGHFPVQSSVGPGIKGLIVLGGGDDRLIEAGRIAMMHPDLQVLVSGAGNRADVIARMGSPPGGHRILVDEKSLTTFQNAIYARHILGASPEERWLLVTSDYHMPRAVSAFQAMDLSVDPWPVVTRGGLSIGQVLHEVVGLAGYWLTGRGATLWPTRCAGSRVTVPTALTQRICRILAG